MILRLGNLEDLAQQSDVDGQAIMRTLTQAEKVSVFMKDLLAKRFYDIFEAVEAMPEELFNSALVEIQLQDLPGTMEDLAFLLHWTREAVRTRLIRITEIGFE